MLNKYAAAVAADDDDDVAATAAFTVFIDMLRLLQKLYLTLPKFTPTLLSDGQVAAASKQQ